MCYLLPRILVNFSTTFMHHKGLTKFPRFKPEELALRIAVFYSFGQFAGFVGGFLAFAISYADGVLAGWRWLFIIGKIDLHSFTIQCGPF